MLNYDKYQCVTNIDTNKEVTKRQQRGNKEVTPNNNDNKDNNDNNDKKNNIPVNDIVKLFNEICKDLTKVSTITDKRKKTIGYRWNKYAIKKDKEGNIIGIRLFEELFNMANESDWLSGRVKKWTATFDWLMIEENMVKVLEGNYDNRTGNGT